MIHKIDVNASVPVEQWGKFFDRFSETNRGRYTSIEVIDSEQGDQELIKNTPLLAIIYDRPGKGDNLMIELGQDELTYAHTIHSPTEVLTAQDAHGLTMAVSITSTDGIKTLIKLHAR